MKLIIELDLEKYKKVTDWTIEYHFKSAILNAIYTAREEDIILDGKQKIKMVKEDQRGEK